MNDTDRIHPEIADGPELLREGLDLRRNMRGRQNGRRVAVEK